MTPEEREEKWARWPQGDAGDAIDFACDHTTRPMPFLEDWRSNRADEWPEYMHWLNVQREGARAASRPSSMAKEPELASDHRKTVCADSRCDKDSAHTQGSEGCYFSPPSQTRPPLMDKEFARAIRGAILASPHLAASGETPQDQWDGSGEQRPWLYVDGALDLDAIAAACAVIARKQVEELEAALKLIAIGEVGGNPDEPFSGYMRCRQIALEALHRKGVEPE